jgi:hypothetical protein
MDRTSCGEPRPHQASLSSVRIIMVFMCVLVVESLCQVAMGQFPILECLVPCLCGSQCLCHVLSDINECVS